MTGLFLDISDLLSYGFIRRAAVPHGGNHCSRHPRVRVSPAVIPRAARSLCRSRRAGLHPAQGQHEHDGGEPQRWSMASDRASQRRPSAPVTGKVAPRYVIGRSIFVQRRIGGPRARLDFHEPHDMLVGASLPFVERRNLCTPLRGEMGRFQHTLWRFVQRNAATLRSGLRTMADHTADHMCSWMVLDPNAGADACVTVGTEPAARFQRPAIAGIRFSHWNGYCSRLVRMRFTDSRNAGAAGTTFDLQPKVARCRLILSLIAIVAVYVDPTEPTGVPWLHLTGGEFAIDPYALAVLSLHLAYSSCVCWVIAHQLLSPQRLATITAWIDVFLGAVVVIFTEGTSSPFWAFFVFAVVAAGAEGGFRRSIVVTTVSVGIYMSLILVAWHGETNVFIVRPVYLAVVGYLTAYLAQQRLNLETQVHQLETVKERNRIARALHDGCVQTLGGINLTLETSQQLICAGRAEEALASLVQLQSSINREHDELRVYVRELADIEPGQPAREYSADTRFVVNADFAGSGVLVDQVFQLVREAVTNIRRHARARTAIVSIAAAAPNVLITVDDDGVGFSDPRQVPWSIASRVADAGGTIRVSRDDAHGAHLKVAIPQA